MTSEPNFRKLIRQGKLQESDLPGWLRTAITCHDEAAAALLDAPKARQRELQPILEGSDAVISAHIDRILRDIAPTSKIDKLNMMKIKAMEVQLLLYQA